MFKMSKDKKLVLDGLGRVVGTVVNGRFSLSECHVTYWAGLCPRELELVSETMQKNGFTY